MQRTLTASRGRTPGSAHTRANSPNASLEPRDGRGARGGAPAAAGARAEGRKSSTEAADSRLRPAATSDTERSECDASAPPSTGPTMAPTV